MCMMCVFVYGVYVYGVCMICMSVYGMYMMCEFYVYGVCV